MTASTRRKQSDSYDVHVSVSWIQLWNTTLNHSSDGDCEESPPDSLLKETFELSTTSSPSPTPPATTTTTTTTQTCSCDRHLHIQVHAHDTSKTQVILCFCKGSPDVIHAFSFLMGRGANVMLQLLFRWLESRTGIIVSQQAFGFTPSQVANCVASWTTAALYVDEQQHGLLVGGEENESASAATATTTTKTATTTLSASTSRGGPKPLELTFAVPEIVASKGLDTISLTIPLTYLMKLCCDIENRRPKSCQGNGFTGNHPDAVVREENSSEDSPIPILKALQCYIAEVFHIDIRSFPLVRATSSTATIGCDGRIRLQDDRLVSQVLHDVKIMVQKRFATISALQDND